jgi:predicted dehydrogenase
VIRAAIVGLSWIGADPAGPPSAGVLGTDVPYSHASALAAVPGVELTAGVDLSPAARDAFTTRWSGRWPGLRAYDDTAAMLAEQRPELVCVATPDHLHVPVALAAIDAGVRMLFCEKPIAIDLADADRLVAAAAATGTTVNVNYTRRWRPEFVDARERVRAGDIGPLGQVFGQTGGPRAMLFRNLTHILDLLCYFADDEPEWVTAELEPGFEDYGTVYRGDGGRDPASEPGGWAHVVFRNGVRGYVAGARSLPAGEATQLLGRDGRIVLDVEGARLIGAGVDPAVRRLAPRFTRAGMAAAVADLVDSHRAGRAPASPPAAARMTVALTDAILRSQANGNVRVAVEPPRSNP